MAVYIPDAIRTAVFQADKGCCAYCQTCEINSGIPLTHDHIQPRSKGGTTVLANLCLACRPCNEFKSDQTEGIDPLTGQLTPLFNPRQQVWSDHFPWNLEGTLITGLTDVGRATVIALHLNNVIIVPTRERWVSVGWHPPTDA